MCAAMLMAASVPQASLAGDSLHSGAPGAGLHPSAPLAGTIKSRRVLTPGTSPIKHVVIIFQENHSFDDLLGSLCSRRTPACDGYTGAVRLADGKRAPNIPEPDIPPGMSHDARAHRKGLRNAWDKVGGCERYPHRCVTHLAPVRIPNLARMATKFAVSDRTFEAIPSSSWGSHFRLASGTPLGFRSGNNPIPSVTGARVRDGGWGCTSHRDAWWRGRKWVPACVPDRSGRGPYRRSPVPYHATLMQRLEGKHLTWHIYQDFRRRRQPRISIWQFCDYFWWCYRNRWDSRHISTYHSFRLAASGGQIMPTVSFVVPIGPVSQHNRTSLERGDNYIGKLVHAVMVGPHWRSSAIFITYDDCGCFYDHVTPPRGWGLRLPMVIVSPWVKRAYTDGRATRQPYGVQAFIQHNFGLGPLSREVSRSYDYHLAFDFRQRPLTGIKITRQTISKREQVRLRKLAPTIEHDVS
jgi:phospholipase C